MKRARTKPPAPGRPTLEGERMYSSSIRMTKAQRAKLTRLGGSAWVRRRIDSAQDYPDFSKV